MHFEEVVVDNPSMDYEVEYVTEETEVLGEVNAINVAVPVSKPANNSKGPVVIKKKPIIRKPGEIVTPVKVRTLGNVKVQQSPLASNLLIPKNPILVRSKVEWQKVQPPLPKVPPTRPAAVRYEETALSPESDDVEYESKEFDHGYAETSVKGVPSSQTQMDRIERKLDMILEKLSQHDEAFKAVNGIVNDLRTELRNSAPGGSKESFGGGSTYEVNIAPPLQPPPPKRKRLVHFPVSDDSYLLRLEDLVEADDQIREEVAMLFKEAPGTSVYEFLRKNVYALFENCSKYTWTGKPSNAMPNVPPANVASKLALVDHLITCAWEMFPHVTREAVAKDFRRALSNFNDTVYIKRRKRMEQRQQTSDALTNCNVNAESAESDL